MSAPGADIRGRRVVITGGAGFLGSALAARLAADNEVVLFDNLRRSSLRFLPRETRARLALVEGDVRDAAALGRALRPGDLVVHMAAIAGVSTYYKEPSLTLDVNLRGVLALLSAFESAPPERVVSISTSEVYGARATRVPESGPYEIGDVADMRWTYAVSKLAGEKLLMARRAETGLAATILRPFNVYGPGQTGEGAVRNFVRAALAGEPLRVAGDGGAVRAWCYVEDFLDGLLAALARPEAVGEAFNLGNPETAVPTLELARRIVEIAGSDSRIEHEPHIGADIRERIPEIAKARRLLGFEPRTDLTRGLEATIDWARRRLADL